MTDEQGNPCMATMRTPKKQYVCQLPYDHEPPHYGQLRYWLDSKPIHHNLTPERLGIADEESH